MQPHNTLRSSKMGEQTASISPTTPLSGMSDYQEQTLETSIGIYLWYSYQTPASTSTLSKTHLLREVPQMKRKLTTRIDRELSTNIVTDTRSFQSLKSATPSWLREKPSRQKLNTFPKQPLPHSRGTWKKVTAVCKDNGLLLIYNEDRAIVHSISIKELSATDIRLIDDSLFSLPNVLGLFLRQSRLNSVTQTTSPTGDRTSSSTTSIKTQPIYLCFPTGQKMKKWRSLLRTFAKPEIYGPLIKGGTHRCHRQIEMKILEAKIASEQRLIASPSIGVLGISLDDSDLVDTPASASGLSHPTDTSTRQDGDDILQLTKSKSITPSSQTNTSSLIANKNGIEITQIATAEEEEEKDDDSDVGMTSGPISGLSGRERIMESRLMASIPSNYEMERKVSDGPNVVAPSCYCLIWMAGDLVAQTKMCISSFKSMTWFDKFSLKDLPSLTSIQIEVMQSGRNGKSGILGIVNLPIETMRRGEAIEGWFPIWATRARESESSSSPTVEGIYTDEVVGEIKIAINVAEEIVLPMRKYLLVEEAISSYGHLDLITSLCKHLDEDHIISHLVDINASRGTIVDHLRELIEAESVNFGDNPALLFRSNTLLTRAIDKYQRLYCSDWLDSCIGQTVRRVCQDQISLEASDSIHYYANPLVVQDSSSPNTTISTESNLDALLRLCKEIWASIYRNRLQCPPDLRRVLYYIRTKVNSQFPQSETHVGPGIQGVGAFVFLRLICPAITTPHLYGLMGSSPSVASSKTLMLIAKVFLALANKRIAFDKDKEPWLGQANNFLTIQAPAYDEFITFVSTVPSKKEIIKDTLGDEADDNFQRLIRMISKHLPLLHRESLPSQEYMLDRPLALAELVSSVVREANVEMPAEGQLDHTGDKENLDHYHKFVDLCCDTEDKAGIYLDRAGYNPDPIDFTKMYSESNNLGVPSTEPYTSISPIDADTSLGYSDPHHLQRSRRATVSGIGVPIASNTSNMNSIGKEVPTKQDRLPMMFASHLKSSNTARLSMDFEEDGKRSSSGRLARGRSSIEEVGRNIGGYVDHSDVKVSEIPSSHRKVKQSWWKRL